MQRFAKWDASNQRRAERWNADALEAKELHLTVATTAGEVVVDVLPTGDPINDYDVMLLVRVPVARAWRWLRRRGEYSVVVHRPRKVIGTAKVLHRRGGLSKDEAKRYADELATLAGGR